MEQCKGTCVFKKIAIGKIFYYEKEQIFVKQKKVGDIEAEAARFQEAKHQAIEQLADLREKVNREAGVIEGAIFDIHMMMLEDPDYCCSVLNIIVSQSTNAEYAVAVTGNSFYEMFATMKDEYMKARAADIKDITERLMNILTARVSDLSSVEEPVILAADDLTPSETVQLDRSKLLGFVTRHGSINSHTAILARTMNIPALIGVDIKKSWHGRKAVIDGDKGLMTVDPNEEVLGKAYALMEKDFRKKELLKMLKGKETITKDGKKLHLYANIGSIADTGMALLNDAEGIGLFRSEFLYLETKDYPTEQEQFVAYKTVTENMAGKKVIIRTLDIGADKKVDYFQLEPEENPALGYRGIRISLTKKDLFKTQLRAILRASAYGNISVMFPMIISLSEVSTAKEILSEVKEALRKEGITFRDIEVGVMIETPAAVMISEELARVTDFLSIGTNDLTQYTLAIDNQNPRLDDFYDAHHPAVIKMIQMVVENGHKGGAWVSLCGELGADPELTETFLRMGIDALSVSPGAILSLRERVRLLDTSL